MGKNYVDIENDHGETLRYRKHANGRGLIAHGAKVHPTAIVESGAYVEPGVRIAANVHVGRGAWVESDAVIGPDADIAPQAHIGPGAAIGAGLDLALMCDVRVGSERAKFGSTFASVGLIPGDGGAFLLTRAVGFSRAVELILTARVFDAQEAYDIGLIHAKVEADRVMEVARERAEQIARLPAPAVQMAKVALYRTYTHDAESALQLTAALQSLVQHTQAHQDAVEAMLTKISKGK